MLAGMMSLERWFGVTARGSTVRAEVIGGVTTFVTTSPTVLTAGLVLYPVLKLLAGRGRELNAGTVTLGAAFLVYYVFGLPH